jgi:hypothetical protein
LVGAGVVVVVLVVLPSVFTLELVVVLSASARGTLIRLIASARAQASPDRPKADPFITIS